MGLADRSERFALPSRSANSAADRLAALTPLTRFLPNRARQVLARPFADRIGVFGGLAERELERS